MEGRIRHTIVFIESHFQETIDRKTLAEMAGLSQSRFSHVFRTQTGTSPREMIRSLRIQLAKKLLTSSHLTIKEIAARVGSNDESHFVRDFETTAGMSPTQWRQAHYPGADEMSQGSNAAQSANKQHSPPIDSTTRQ